jgi:hypothetical protein
MVNFYLCHLIQSAPMLSVFTLHHQNERSGRVYRFGQEIHFLKCIAHYLTCLKLNSEAVVIFFSVIYKQKAPFLIVSSCAYFFTRRQRDGKEPFSNCIEILSDFKIGAWFGSAAISIIRSLSSKSFFVLIVLLV